MWGKYRYRRDGWCEVLVHLDPLAETICCSGWTPSLRKFDQKPQGVTVVPLYNEQPDQSGWEQWTKVHIHPPPSPTSHFMVSFFGHTGPIPHGCPSAAHPKPKLSEATKQMQGLRIQGHFAHKAESP